MLAIDRSIAIMLGTAAEAFVDDTAQDTEDHDHDAIWEIIGPLVAEDEDDIAQLATCEADLRALGYCAPDDPEGAAGYYDAVALWCDIMSTDAPDTKAELLALRTGRWLRLAARMLRGEAGQPSPDHARAILGVTEGPLTPADAKLVADFGAARVTAITADPVLTLDPIARLQAAGAVSTYTRAAEAQAARAVCATCLDTHTMTLRDRQVPCTFCPTPCEACRAGGNGAYCAKTPCACDCHVGRTRGSVGTASCRRRSNA